MRRVALCAGCLLVAATTFAPPAMALSRADKKIVRDFKRHHRHGYKVVGVAHSSFTDWVAVWFLSGKTGDHWAHGGAAFYKQGRHGRPPHNDAYFVGPSPHYVVSVDGTGTYDDVETTVNPDDGSTKTFSTHADLHWSGTFGTPRNPVSLRLDEDGGDARRTAVTGSLSYRETSNPPSPDDASCTGTVSGGVGLYWRPVHKLTRFEFSLGATSSSADGNCNMIQIQDPTTEDDVSATFLRSKKPTHGRGANRGNVIFSSFSGSPMLRLHRHEPPSDGGPTIDKSFSLDGTARFDLVGLGG